MIRRLTPRQLAADGAVALAAFALFGLSVVVLGGGVSEAVVALGYSVALAFRRTFTILALGLAWVTAVAEMAAHVWPVVAANVLVVLVLYATGAHARRSVRWIGFASAIVAAVCVAVYILAEAERRGESGGAAETVFTGAFTFSAALAGFLLSWTVGFIARILARSREQRAATIAVQREVVAEQERTRIARDMHDVVAHSLAVVIAQADGARYLRESDPAAVDEALRTIAATSRDALADVRVLLAQLRHDQGQSPQPELADLDRLYERFRSAGIDLRVLATGQPMPLGTSAQLAVFRIVQESLTNALRHAEPGAPVEVRFDWAPGGLHLAVLSTARSDAAPATGGHGLAGMAERAALVGGNFDAARDGALFVVRAWLPGGLTGALPVPIVAPGGAPR